MRPLAALVGLIVLAGCSVFGDDSEPIDDILLVSAGPSVESGPVLALRTQGDQGCGGEILVDEDAAPGRLSLNVRGADPAGSDVECFTTAPFYAAVLLPRGAVGGGPVDIAVRHQGATDLYQYVPNAGGGSLLAVRTSTTRLGTP